MTIKLGRENIQRLIRKVIEKYEKESGRPFKLNQTVTNYAGLSKQLSALAESLPERFPEKFASDSNGRYAVNGAQIRDAYFGKVDSLKDHFYEASHLYLYEKLSADCKEEVSETEVQPVVAPAFAEQPLVMPVRKKHPLVVICFALAFLFLFAAFNWFTVNQRLASLVRDMNLLPYKPSPAEIVALEGIWKIYTGSPQARSWDSSRYHMTVPNMMEIHYKDGYFVFNRYGPAFNQKGYIQFESPGVVSIHSYVISDSVYSVSPKLTLMVLEKDKIILNAISASWNFDAKNNKVIGIREVYLKEGHGSLAIVENTLDNTYCECRILDWTKPDKSIERVQLQNLRLEEIKEVEVRSRLDENSILLKDQDSLLVPKKPGKNATYPNNMQANARN